MRRLVVSFTLGVGLLTATAAYAGPIGYSVQNFGSGNGGRLYSIDLATGIATELGIVVGFGDAEGLTWVGNRLFGIGGVVEELWDLTTPPGALIGGTGPRDGIDAGLGDAPNGTVYNIQGSAGLSVLYTINTGTGAATLVGSSSIFVDNIAINAAGQAYAVDAIFTNSLYSVNLATGALTLIGSLGISPFEQGGTDFDATGVLWLVLSNGQIFTVNTGTGAATFVAQSTINGIPACCFEGLAIINDQAVPEPGSLLLLGSGLAAVAAWRRRRV